MRHYFAYGSNMNPQRVRDRGLTVAGAQAAWLTGVRLTFAKSSPARPGIGHACLEYDPAGRVEGVLYCLGRDEDIVLMDRFESTPFNYSRDVVWVETTEGPVAAWTYHANPAVRAADLRPERGYLAHLLAGRGYLSAAYYDTLSRWPCIEDGAG